MASTWAYLRMLYVSRPSNSWTWNTDIQYKYSVYLPLGVLHPAVQYPSRPLNLSRVSSRPLSITPVIPIPRFRRKRTLAFFLLRDAASLTCNNHTRQKERDIRSVTRIFLVGGAFFSFLLRLSLRACDTYPLFNIMIPLPWNHTWERLNNGTKCCASPGLSWYLLGEKEGPFFTLADRLLGVTYTPHCLGQIGNLVVCCGVARVDDGMPRWKEISYWSTILYCLYHNLLRSVSLKQQ